MSEVISKTDPKMDALMLVAQREVVQFIQESLPKWLNEVQLAGSFVISQRNMSYGQSQGFQYDEIWMLTSIAKRFPEPDEVRISDHPTTLVPDGSFVKRVN